MTEDEVRALVLEHAKPFATKRIGAYGLRGWCAANGVNLGNAGAFMLGKCKPCKDLLGALGLEYRIEPISPTDQVPA